MIACRRFAVSARLTYNFGMAGRLRLLKWAHSAVAFFLLACLVYILYAGVTATFNLALFVAVAAIIVEGIAISLNHWQCPLTTLAERCGAEKGSVADIFMPKAVAKNLFKYSPFLFAAELVLLGIRFVTG
jgi:hypothetical protein